MAIAVNVVVGMMKMDEDIYTEEGAEEMFDDDNLSAEELGFMIGYIQAG